MVSLNSSDFGWIENITSADLSGTETLKAAPASGNLYLEYISINCVAAITVTIGSGETASAVDTAIIGPIAFTAAASGQYVIHFPRPVKIDATTAITADASGAGAVNVVLIGHTEL